MTSQLTPDTIVGISVSKPTDLVATGAGEVHIDFVFVEIVRYLLSAGATVAYGGDLRTGGYTEQMFELVRTYGWDERPDPSRLRSYLAWHVAADLTAEDRATWKTIATFVTVPPPDDDGRLTAEKPADGTTRLRSALAFQAMRARLAEDATAQVVLGGRSYGQTGIVPGIVEEAALAIDGGNALFPIGGFGGAGKLVVQALQGDEPPELSLDYQIEHGDEIFKQMVDLIGADTAARELRGRVEQLKAANWPELDNGLDAADNELLAATPDFLRIPALVIRGLRRLTM